MLLPERAAAHILINSREIGDAQPIRLWRKRNQAALFEFSIPRKIRIRNRGLEYELRQGDLVELWYGLGTGQQRIFYGYLPSTLSDLSLSESDSLVRVVAYDFIGQLQDRYITLGDSSSSFLNPVGQEIGGLIATLAKTVMDSQYGSSGSVLVGGVKGTNPQQFVTTEKTIYGTKTAKGFIDDYTALAFDDTNYPDTPLLYEYHQRDRTLIWRKELKTTSPPALKLTVGKDAIVGGTIQRMPVYSDSVVSTADSKVSWTHSDRDTSRRWGGRRFWASSSTKSSFQSDAYESAVRLVELAKHERRAFSIIAMRDAFLLYPGDILFLENGESVGVASGGYRVSEVDIQLSPAPIAKIVVGEAQKLLTDYL